MKDVVNYLIEKGLVFYWGTSQWSADRIKQAHEVCEKRNLIKPIAVKGTAPIIHIQDNISIPNNGLNTKYRITAIMHAKPENTNCLSDSPKYTLSV